MEIAELESLIVRYTPAMRLLASTICTNPDDAVQQTFVKLATTEATPAQPAAWLFRVVKNEAISQARSDKRRKNRERQSVPRPALFESTPKELDRDQLGEGMSQLDPLERQIVVARIWGGLSFDEIAKDLQISSSSAHRRYHRALSQLRQYLGASSLV